MNRDYVHIDKYNALKEKDSAWRDKYIQQKEHNKLLTDELNVIRQTIVDGVYDDTEFLMCSGMIVNNKRCGEWRWTYKNEESTTYCMGMYKHGVKEGKWTWYYPNGDVQFTEHYVNDIKHGEYVYYHANGVKSIVGLYDKNKKYGVWVYYDINGRQTSDKLYKNK